MRILILAALPLAVILASPPASAQCIMSYCRDRTTETTPTRNYIVNQNRQIIGDIYDPKHGRRVQIRDNDRQILFYVEKDGTITNTRRQKIGTIEGQ